MSAARDLADRFHGEWMAFHPFAANALGVPGYDHLVPDASEEGADGWAARVGQIEAEAEALARSGLSPADGITVSCLLEYARAELDYVASAPAEHTVTPMPFLGPAELLAVAARTLVPDPQAAEDYLARLRGAGTWVDQQTERLRTGAAKGRLPVAPLAERALEWAENVLGPDVPEALAAPSPPEGWEGAAGWQGERDRLAREVVKPALGRWASQVRELLPASRPGEHAGLTYVPGGEADYLRAIRTNTTMPASARDLHDLGLSEVGALEARALELGAQLGLGDLAAVHEALRSPANRMAPDDAIKAAVSAIRRAEARAPEAFPAPLPEPCAVTPMPPAVGASGAAPHYTHPRSDGRRPGTFWFNTLRPTGGTGWDLEGVAFHEAVPGHHLQVARLALMPALPELQRVRFVNVFAEGWGLYAEQLAEEMGLYSGPESLLGALSAALMRAARLVLDTGIHAFGWSRDRALDYFVAHVPMPTGFLADEIDRYIAMPGQALSYHTGKLEILSARGRAQDRLGPAFDLKAFHGALLDSGSLPVPVMHRKVDAWVAGV
jgi:uncharacterized protein (DUF885 family)